MESNKTSYRASQFAYPRGFKHSGGTRVAAFFGVLIASIAGIFTPPVLAQSADLSNISAATFGCMRRNTRGLGGWIEYEGDNEGRIRVFATGVGQVGELTYRFNPDRQTLGITHVRGRAPFQQVRNGLEDTADKCREGQYK